MDDDDVQDASISLDDATTPVKPTASTTAAASTEPAASGTSTPTAAASSALKTTVEDEEPAASTAAAPAADEPAPPKPPRPLTEQQKNEQTLKEAFPTVDLAVVKAVLTASRGNIESAFHALLEMTDPNAVAQEPEEEAAPPPQPPRPSSNLQAGAPNAGRLSPNSQLLADEEYARQLAQHYEQEAGQYEARTSSGRYGGGRSAHGGPPYPPRTSSSRGNDSLKPNEMWGDRDHSFLDDDLPVIKENLRKGFVETQTKFNTWFSGIKKKIDEEWNIGDEEHEDDDGSPGGARRQRQYEQEARRQQQAGRGGFGRQPPRRSGDYDADPELLSDDFAGIQLHGDGTPVRNQNLFRPPPSTSPRPNSERKVAFSDKNETIDMYSASPKLPPKDGPASGATPAATNTGAKASKWQPMSSVDPTPLADNDDPFSLGDSEDEKDTTAAAKPAAAGKADAKSDSSAAPTDEAERLRKAAAEAMADSLVEDKPKA